MDQKNKEETLDMNDVDSNKAYEVAGQVAANAFSKDTEPPDFAAIDPNKKLPPHKRLAAWHKNLGKKQKIALLVVALLIIGGGCFLAYALLKDNSTPLSQSAVIKKPETVPSLLTGLPVKPEVNKKQVTAIMIENSPDARPQSGLRDAGLVYEAVAEGGITRFLVLFQDTDSDYIGPVRSVRPYYLDWLVPFDGAVAHVGGSPTALKQIRDQNIKDLDQFSNSQAYQRVTNRYAPHNVYTSTKNLNKVESQKGYKKSQYIGFAHLPKEQKATKVTAKNITMNLSGPLFNVGYKYDSVSNTYKRSEGGQPHIDEKTKKQLSPKVVVALVMNRTQDGVYSVYRTTGEGSAFIFQGGTVIKGKWTKKDRKKQFSFVDANNKVIKLSPGKAWVTVVENGAVKYSP